MTETAVFLERECRIIPEKQQKHFNHINEQSEQILSLIELAQQPAFVLLGEPGMGKTSSLEALAEYLGGHYVTAQNFILEDNNTLESKQFYCIDALDEARAENNSSILLKIRERIAKLSKFCIACRIADWHPTDDEHFQYVAPEKSLTLAELLPLSKPQSIQLLITEGIEYPEAFLSQADEFGFVDMLGNPKSLEILAKAFLQNDQQWPTKSSEAFELACISLLREHNKHHKKAQRGTPVSDESLLNAAGWLCSLMLLSNRATIADTGAEDLADSALQIEAVLDEFIGSHELITLVLQRRVFQKTGNNGCFAPVHRTIAEYLAARYLSRQIEANGLLAGRIAALILTSSEHLVSNLRGLAGWLAALSEPMRDRIFAADPAAVLDYGDLYLLSTKDKQKLIECLSSKASFEDTWERRNQPLRHSPLVQTDMQNFLLDWFLKLSESNKNKRGSISAKAQLLTAVTLFDALALQNKDPIWEKALIGLLKNSETSPYEQSHALPALEKHARCLPKTYLELLEEIYNDRVDDYEKSMVGDMLYTLYPEYLSPSETLRYYATPNRYFTNNFRRFWKYDLDQKTPNNLLLRWMNAIETSLAQGNFEPDKDKFYDNEPNGISAIIVRAITNFGTEQKPEKLTEWLSWCSFGHESPFSLSAEGNQTLLEWKRAHPEQLKNVIKQRLRTMENCFHLVDYKIIDHLALPKMGAFWLELSQLLLAETNLPKFAERSAEALSNAFRYLEHNPQKEINLEDIEQTAALHPELRKALDNRRICKLEKNWIRESWLRKKENEAEQKKLKKKREDDLKQLLGQLDIIRSGEHLQFLYHAAWAESTNNHINNSIHGWILQKLSEYPELKEATREGYISCLKTLTKQDIIEAESLRKNDQTLLKALPSYLGANNLFNQSPITFIALDKEILETLTTLLLGHSHQELPEWLVLLSLTPPDWITQIWNHIYQSRIKKKEDLRLPFIQEFKHYSRLNQLAQNLLPRTLEQWPAKISNTNLSGFADLLVAMIRHCPKKLSILINSRLQKKSISPKQNAYLMMAGMWSQPRLFYPQLKLLLQKKPASRMPYLNFIGHLKRYAQYDNENLDTPNWNVETVGLLFRLFAPLCPVHYTDGYASNLDEGRGFLNSLGRQLTIKPNADGVRELQSLRNDKTLASWKMYFDRLLTDYTQALAEKNYTTPTPKQVAEVLKNKKPANQNDLMAVTLEALNQLQNEVKNSPTNLIHRFWNVDPNGQKPIPPRRPETECRNVIVDWLSAHLKQQGITPLSEPLHGAGNQSDIGLFTQRPNQTDLLLPIEIKGDWNKSKNGRDLWHAPKHQLYDKYVTDQRTGGNGLYLVLWMGEPDKVAPHPNNTKLNTADALEKALTQQIESLLGEATKNVKLFVLDLSIST